jgi:hypothetical protein
MIRRVSALLLLLLLLALAACAPPDGSRTACDRLPGTIATLSIPASTTCYPDTKRDISLTNLSTERLAITWREAGAVLPALELAEYLDDTFTLAITYDEGGTGAVEGAWPDYRVIMDPHADTWKVVQSVLAVRLGEVAAQRGREALGEAERRAREFAFQTLCGALSDYPDLRAAAQCP